VFLVPERGADGKHSREQRDIRPNHTARDVYLN
jgi:hypothetical protein